MVKTTVIEAINKFKVKYSNQHDTVTVSTRRGAGQHTMTDIKPEDDDALNDVHQRVKNIGDASVEWFLVISMVAAAEHRQLGRTMTDAEMERTRVWIAGRRTSSTS